MFLLKDLPEDRYVERFSQKYGPIDPKRLNLFLTVLRSGSDLLVELDNFLERFGLTHGRWITLVLLMREPDLSARPATLAEKQGVRRATMTGLTQRLEMDGLVRRIPDDEDGRSVRICLTEAGADLLQAIMPEYYRRVGDMTAGIPDEQVEAAVMAINELSGRADLLSAP
nr:MarR family transcriptional regulator [uncultured Hyphomonas sp.]